MISALPLKQARAVFYCHPEVMFGGPRNSGENQYYNNTDKHTVCLCAAGNWPQNVSLCYEPKLSVCSQDGDVHEEQHSP